MSDSRSAGETARHAASRAKQTAVRAGRFLSVVGGAATWTAFWLVVARFRWVQGATVSAALIAVTFLTPVVLGALWYLSGLAGVDVDLPVSTPDVDLSTTSG